MELASGLWDWGQQGGPPLLGMVALLPAGGLSCVGEALLASSWTPCPPGEGVERGEGFPHLRVGIPREGSACDQPGEGGSQEKGCKVLPQRDLYGRDQPKDYIIVLFYREGN